MVLSPAGLRALRQGSELTPSVPGVFPCSIVIEPRVSSVGSEASQLDLGLAQMLLQQKRDKDKVDADALIGT